MAGTLPRLDLLPPAPIEAAERFLSIGETAHQQIANSGLGVPVAHQTYRGEMPESITALDDDQLGNLLAEIDALVGYADFKLAQAEIDLEAAKQFATYVESTVRIAIRAEGRKFTVSDKDDIVNTDQRVVDARFRLLNSEAIYRYTRAIRDRAQRNWETVSRRITQRGQQLDRINRGNNVHGVPMTSRNAFRR